MTDRRGLLTILGGAIAAATALTAQNAPKQIVAKTVGMQALPKPFTGWEARFVEVEFPAGVASNAHRHPGFVLGYVVEGKFRFAINGEEPRTLQAGETFYEPPGANHTVGDSADPRGAARILAIIVAPVEQA